MKEIYTKADIADFIENGVRMNGMTIDKDNYQICFAPCGVIIKKGGDTVNEIALDMSEMGDEKGINVIYKWVHINLN